MKDFTRKFERIKGLKPMLRGLRLERLFNEIFEEHGILLERSFKNTDGSQQIDGAIEINHRIFIVEIKWENSKTLAASKLYSFLGKINSKIDGTLGLFISYDELKKNFLDSARGGIKQNCIIIHGEENILPVISGEASIAEYIWYLYQQASTKNRITVPISEFMSLPRKTIKAKRTSANDKWKEVYDALVSEKNIGDFELKLNANYDQIDDLVEKTIILYPILQNIHNIHSKIDYLLNTIISHDEAKIELYNSLVRMLISSHWIKYADEYLLDKTKNISKPRVDVAAEVVYNVVPYLTEKEGQWEEENKASIVLDFIYDHLSDESKILLAKAYAEIYCDSTRRDKFPQKRFANKIFQDINDADKWNIIKDVVVDQIAQYKADEVVFGRSSKKNKERAIRLVKSKFERIIEEAELKDVNRQLVRMYRQAEIN